MNYIADEHGFRVAATNLPQAPIAAPVEPVVAAETPAAVVPEVKAVPIVADAAPVVTAPVVAPTPIVAAAPIAYATHPVAHDITLFDPFAKSAVEKLDAEVTPIVGAPVAYSAIPVAAPVKVEQPVQAAVPATYVTSPYVYAHQAAPVYTTNYVPATVPVVTAPVVAPSSQFHGQVIIIYFL